jgi:hypothetical protein
MTSEKAAAAIEPTRPPTVHPWFVPAIVEGFVLVARERPNFHDTPNPTFGIIFLDSRLRTPNACASFEGGSGGMR